MDPSKIQPAGASPAASAAPPEDAGAAPAAAAAADAQPWALGKDEWVAFRREYRDSIKALGERMQPKAQPAPADAGAPAPAASADAMAELALRDAMDDLGLPLTKAQKAHVRRLYRAEKPPQLESWLSDTVAVFGLSTNVPVTPAAPVAPAGPRPPNPGAPGGAAPIEQLPDDPLAIPADVLRGISPEDFAKNHQRLLSQRRMLHVPALRPGSK